MSPSNIDDFDEASPQNWDAWCSGAERRLVTILMIMMMMEESGSVECRQQGKEVVEGSARRGTQGRRDTVMLSLRFHGHLDGALA